MFRSPRTLQIVGMVSLSLVVADAARAFVPVATAHRVTNTKNGRNEQPTLDRRGYNVVFVSNSDHLAGVAVPASGAFDFDATGNGFSSGTVAGPSCPNCSAADDSAGNLYLWRRRRKGGQPANSMRQLTFATSGGFDANEHPDMDSRGRWVTWNSDRDLVGENADGNSEIFLMDLDEDVILQITRTEGGTGNANRTATVSDRGAIIAFDSTRDFSASARCRRPDGVTPCGNGDGNSEVMYYERATGQFTQVTATTGDAGDAQANPRVSADGNFIVFQSTRDFSGALGGGITCTGLGGNGPCGNDGNGEIMLYDIGQRHLVQVTDTVHQMYCNARTSNQRPEVARKARLIVFQSECERQLNPEGCGSCGGNDEVFLADLKRGTVTQVTISGGGWNRVPRIADAGNYVVFDSNRSYLGLNEAHNDTLYVLRRGSTRRRGGLTALLQVEEDTALKDAGIQQNPKTQVTRISFAGGFPASERIGFSGNGRMVGFESSKNVGNQEVWLVDRNLCTHGGADCP